jgi:CRISPR-associated protein Cas5d
MSYGIKLHCWGEFALFSRPEFKSERMSYEVMTPSTARGIIEAVYWKPEIRWVIDAIRVLRPIRFTSQRRNEVSAKIPAGAVSSAMKAGQGNLGLYIEDVRQQRAAMLLRDVAYLIEAHFDLLGGSDNEAKHLDIFNRRARSGQAFTRPYFGTRECAAHFAQADCDPMPVDELPADQRNKDLGWMLHDFEYEPSVDYRRKTMVGPKFFHAKLNDGVIRVPRFDSEEVRG